MKHQKFEKFLWNHFLENFNNASCSFHYLCFCSLHNNPALTQHLYITICSLVSYQYLQNYICCYVKHYGFITIICMEVSLNLAGNELHKRVAFYWKYHCVKFNWHLQNMVQSWCCKTNHAKGRHHRLKKIHLKLVVKYMILEV